ncbi:DUF2634 domain-containing protein [Cytobacillus solani]|uniref:DUF2634 domain-containing protein n=1 Tax=Cytobacillus solani TaxID=1637975 RepID=UPI00207A90D6|nr:DUF2634 domain-containing protein [Cytobacillus solani]USK54364.1 DUF2634 domain-containing protein [Cytobacillus solani]
MFPEIVNIDNIPIETTQDELPEIKPSFLFDFQKGEFVLVNGNPVRVEGIEALKVWIEKTLRTEKYRYKVYEGTDYGTSLEDLIGQNLPPSFVESEMQREINESLLRHPIIDSLSNFELEKNKSNLKVKFTVNLVGESSFEQELTYNV